MADPNKPTLFICYSHTDQKYREQFSKFLQTDRLKDSVRIFSDAAIEPGDEWQKTILECLRQATAALVLVSQDFMISPFIQQVELRELLAGFIRDGLRLYLVPVRSTNYQGTYLERFQWARPPDKPLSLLTPEQQEEAMVAICLRIGNELVQKAPDPVTAAHTIACLESVPKLDLPSVYDVEEPLGEGEFARCFKARDQLLGKTVIIKVLNTPLSQDSPGYDKYVRSASKLTHRNILGLLFSQANKLPHFIVTPAVGDDTLEKRLRAGRMTVAAAVDLTIKLAGTLAYAHGKACVHGRLRPSEIRFDGEDEPVLSGFRTLAALREPPSTPAAERRLTLHEFLAASPESRETGVIDPKTDQYQLGLLVYEMIAGAAPVRVADTSWASLLNPAIAGTLLRPRPLKEFVPGCGARVSDAVMRMLSVDPAARFESLEQLTDVLRAERTVASWVEEAKASYRRCAQDDRFYETLYAKLFEVPEIREMFIGRPMDRQYQLLRDALWLLLSFAKGDERTEPTILSGIARTHARFEPRQFEQFRDAVLAAVAAHDPQGASAVAAWRDALAPGIDYLMSRAGKAAYAGA
jgi:serine/threonine protein kinase